MLWQVAHTIGETLGYRAVVVNIYRPAFDDMFTAAAVGSDESVELLLGQTIAARDLDAAVRAPLRAARRLLRPAGRASTGTRFPAAPTRRRSSPRDDPDAWQADDALFVPLRGASGKLLGVVSVDEPESGRRPERRRDRRPRGELQARGPGDPDRAGRGLGGPAPAHARARARGVGPAGPGGRRARAAPGGLRRHPRRARLRQGGDRAGRRAARPARAGGRRRLDGGRPGREPGHEHGLLRAALHPRVRGGRLLPRAARRGRDASRAEERRTTSPS